MKRYAAIFFIFLLALSGSAYAHPGGLDSSGCHNERATGGYHCHNSSSRSGGISGGDIGDVLLAIGAVIVVAAIVSCASEENIERLNNFEPFVSMQTDDASFGFNYTLLKF